MAKYPGATLFRSRFIFEPKIVLAAAVIVLFALCLPAGAPRAQLANDLEVQLGMGLAFPAAPDSFKTARGAGFSLTGAVHIPVWLTSIVASWDYARLPLDAEGDFSAGAANFYSGTLSVAFGFPFGDGPRVYVLGGGGIFHMIVSDIKFEINGSPRTIPATSQTKASFLVGGGVQVPLNQNAFRIFLEARYIQGATEGDPTAFVPVTLGILF